MGTNIKTALSCLTLGFIFGAMFGILITTSYLFYEYLPELNRLRATAAIQQERIEFLITPISEVEFGTINSIPTK